MQSPRPVEPSSTTPPVGASIRAWLAQAAERLVPRIRRHLRKAGLEELADDVLQEVVYEALRSEKKYDPSRNLEYWLHGIAMKVVKRHVERSVKDRRRLVREPLADREGIEALDAQLHRAGAGQRGAGADERLASWQEAEATLSSLPEQHRQMLRLFYYDHDQDYEAVAAALRIKPATARVRHFRALEAARKGSLR